MPLMSARKELEFRGLRRKPVLATMPTLNVK